MQNHLQLRRIWRRNHVRKRNRKNYLRTIWSQSLFHRFFGFRCSVSVNVLLTPSSGHRSPCAGTAQVGQGSRCEDSTGSWVRRASLPHSNRAEDKDSTWARLSRPAGYVNAYFLEQQWDINTSARTEFRQKDHRHGFSGILLLRPPVPITVCTAPFLI